MYNTVQNTPHAPDYRSPDKALSGGYATSGGDPRNSLLSQMSKNDQQLLVPKGPNFKAKKPTKIVMGGPSNMEKRIISRTS